MKNLMLALIVLALSVCLGLLIVHYPGYMLLSAGPYRIETTLWFGILCLMLCYHLLSLLWRLAGTTLGLRQRLRNWRNERKRHKSHIGTITGLCALAEGQFAAAEKTLIQTAKHSDTPLVHYLSAAKAAQQQGALSRRDAYLKQAIESTPSAHKAVGLTQAELQLEARQYEEALATLQALRRQYPKQQHVLMRLQETLVILKDWEQLIELLPALRQNKCLTKAALETLASKTYEAHLAEVASRHDSAELKACWETLPKQAKRNTNNILRIANHCLGSGQETEACQHLLQSLQRNWDARALGLLAKLGPDAATEALKKTERWLREHPHDSDLLHCLEQLSSTLGLHGKAKDFAAQRARLAADSDTTTPWAAD